MGEGMSRARDRRKRREREAWAKRKAERHTQARMRAMFALVTCDECHGSGRAPDHAISDVFGSMDSPLGMYQMCRKCGGDFSVRVGTIEINVTI